ncbi:MAG: hypothetical protein LBB88_05995 [Planctomycetaceae bacterium]|jgi:hypothetical protein|nr:hypothetical protein [Planctomycetaceae bacterium]
MKSQAIPEITQNNFRFLLPSKIAAVVDKICETKKCPIKTALLEFYNSKLYAELEIEKTKRWWQSPEQLFNELENSEELEELK